MKDPVARERAEEAIEEVGKVDRLRQLDSTAQDRKIEELRRLVNKADEGSIGANPTFGAPAFPSAWEPSGSDAARVAVLTIVLCFENLRDALQFDTWGGLQDATGLNERAAVLRGWLGSVTDEETAAATACYDELAGT